MRYANMKIFAGVLILFSILQCALSISAVFAQGNSDPADYIPAKKDIVSHWLDYLERKLEVTQRFYSAISRDMFLYFILFLVPFIMVMGALSWYLLVRCREMIKEEIEKYRSGGASAEMRHGGGKVPAQDVDVAVGRIYESMGIAYEGKQEYGFALLWYALAFKNFMNKSDIIISQDHKTRLLEWLTRCANKISTVTDLEFNRINDIIRSISEERFLSYREKLLARLSTLRK